MCMKTLSSKYVCYIIAINVYKGLTFFLKLSAEAVRSSGTGPGEERVLIAGETCLSFWEKNVVGY